jgi:hypothetical protein
MEYPVLVGFKVLQENLDKADQLAQQENPGQLGYQEAHQTQGQQVKLGQLVNQDCWVQRVKLAQPDV